MRVAVITPFHRPNIEWLAQCHASVRAQTHACTHIVISDGGGEMPLAGFTGEFLRLDHKHADYGETPRAVATMVAIGEGYDAIAYLDDDNWFEPWHIAKLLVLHQQTGAAICISPSTLHDLDGQPMGPCTESDGLNFTDTNCYLLFRPAFGLLSSWIVKPRQFMGLGHGDFYLWQTLARSGLPRALSDRAGVAYRTSWPIHYHRLGRNPPAGCKPEERGLFYVQLRQQMLDHFNRQ